MPQLQQTFSPPPLRGDQRGLLLGATGSGKSYMARHLLKVARKAGWRIVIVDPKKGWMGRGKDRVPFADKGELSTVDRPVLVNEFHPEYPVQIFQPVEWDEQCDTFFTDVLEEGNTFVYFDEITQLADATRVPMKFKVLWTQGRAANVAAWCGSQRPRGIPLICKDQAEVWFIFRIKSLDDRKVVAGYVPVDETPELIEQQIPPRWFWYYNDSLDKAVLVKPLVVKGAKVA